MSRKLEGKYALYTDAGLVAWGTTRKRAETMAKRIRYGSATVATISGTPLQKYKGGKKVNPARKVKTVTKKQKRARAATSRKRSGIASAVRSLLKKTNPSAKITGARVVKLRDGGLTIRPIKPVRSNPRSGFDTQAEAERFARHIEKHAKAKVVKKGSKHVVVWTKKGHLYR